MYKIIGADGKEYGPVSAEVLREWICQGRANSQTQVAPEGTNDWKPLAQALEFATALASAAQAGLVPGPIGPPPLMPRTNSLAGVSLALGILSVTVCMCCCYGVPFNIASLICGFMALSQISQAPQTERGKEMAIAGIVLSILSFILGAVLLILSLTINSSDLIRRIQRL